VRIVKLTGRLVAVARRVAHYTEMQGRWISQWATRVYSRIHTTRVVLVA
jgi:hypothetical protein